MREDGERYLQAGAYAARGAAEHLADGLRAAVPRHVQVTETVHGDGRSLFRVRVGPVGSDASLSSLVDAIKAA